MTTVVDVTQGEKILKWATVTELNGATITLATVKVSLTPDGGDHTWVSPDASDQVSVSVVRVAILVDSRFTPGPHFLYVKVTDSPEIEFVKPARGLVTVT